MKITKYPQGYDDEVYGMVTQFEENDVIAQVMYLSAYNDIPEYWTFEIIQLHTFNPFCPKYPTLDTVRSLKAICDAALEVIGKERL